MTLFASRRGFLAGASAGAACAALPAVTSAAAPSPASLWVERRILEVAGRPAPVFGIRRPDGGHGLFLDPGQRFRVRLENRTDEETVIHWHGQTPPYLQDGVADADRPLIKPGAAVDYDFAPRPGTHWMHSHHGLQEQLLMAAPLIVRTAADLRADEQEVTILLHDFTFRDPAEVLAELTGGGGHHGHHGHVMPTPTPDPHAGHGAAAAGSAAGPTGGPTAGMVHDLNDVEYDAYLANDRTLDDPQVVTVERGGRVRLRIINGAASTAFHLDFGGLTGTVTAVDGNPVVPVAGTGFGLSMGQRLDVVLQLPAAGGVFPVLAQREGERQRTGVILATPGAAVGKIAALADTATGPLDGTAEMRFAAVTPLPERPADVAFTTMLTGGMTPYVWSMDDAVFGRHKPLTVKAGQRVAVTMVNRSGMSHPMHLHGHHFQVTAINGRPLSGAVRDTVSVPTDGTVTFVFDADNPGRWPFHCHNLLHMATGMMTEVVYA